MPELWRPVVGDDKYKISDQGRVYSVRSDLIMKQVLLDGRYPALHLGSKMRKVHHLVAEAFIGPRPEGLCCLHKNDIKTDNRAENLYWGTLSQNQMDSFRNGTHRQQWGETNSRAKLTNSDVLLIRSAEGTCKAIGDRFGVSPMTVSLIKRKKRWAHV